MNPQQLISRQLRLERAALLTKSISRAELTQCLTGESLLTRYQGVGMTFISETKFGRTSVSSRSVGHIPERK